MTDSEPSWAEMSGTQHLPRHRAAALPEEDPPTGLDPSSEPVIIAHAVTIILGALVTAGWVAIPNTAIDAIGTLVALALSTVGAVLARARVSPLSGGLWASVKDYVEARIAAELAKHQL